VAGAAKLISVVLAGVLGLATYVYLIGGLVLALRLNHAGFAPLPTITELPRQQLVGTGLVAVVVPTLLLAPVAFLAIWIDRHRPKAVLDHIVCAATAGVLFGAVAGLLLRNWVYFAIYGGVAVATYAFGLLASAFLRDPKVADWQAWVLVAVATGLVGAIGRVLIDLGTSTLPAAVVCATDVKYNFVGSYIGQSDSTVYIGVAGSMNKATRVIAIPSSRVGEVLLGTTNRNLCVVKKPN
jgi:hypothetical protein